MLVERTYWNSTHSGYRWGDKSVPLAPGNSDFDLITKAIADGECEVVDAPFGIIHQTFDHRGEHSGYRGVFGFVPVYQASDLLDLVLRQIEDGRAQIHDRSQDTPHVPGPVFEKLVFSLMLESPWPIQSKCSGMFNYRSRHGAPSFPYRFTLSNLPATESRFDIRQQHYGLQPAPEFRTQNHFGLLEIDVPIGRLRNLFQSERNLLADVERTSLKMFADMHLAETRRSSPDIEWLINVPHLYTSHFFLEIANAISDTVKHEYGSTPLGYLYEGYGQVQPTIYGCTAQGTYYLKVLGDYRRPVNSFPPEPLLHSLERHDDNAQSPFYLRQGALRRVAEMAKLGFHAEALAPLNGFLEVALLQTLLACISQEPTLVELMKGMGHATRIDIFTYVCSALNGQYPCDEEFKSTLDTIKKIYRHRNAYVHDLLLPDMIGRPTVLDRRKLESYFHGFISIHEQQLFFMRLDSFARDGTARQLVNNWIRARA